MYAPALKLLAVSTYLADCKCFTVPGREFIVYIVNRSGDRRTYFPAHYPTHPTSMTQGNSINLPKTGLTNAARACFAATGHGGSIFPPSAPSCSVSQAFSTAAGRTNIAPREQHSTSGRGSFWRGCGSYPPSPPMVLNPRDPRRSRGIIVLPTRLCRILFQEESRSREEYEFALIS